MRAGILLLALVTLAFGVGATYIPSTIVINEIAWGGAVWDHTAEWIELVNVSDKPINLDGWRLVSSDGSPNVLLHGTLEAWDPEVPEGAFLLLERANDASVPGMTADIIYAGALDDGGEALFLLDSEGRLVDSANAPEVPDAVTAWPAGSGAQGAPAHASMERVDVTAGDDPGNWASWRPDDDTPLLLDVTGSPRHQNSAFNIPPLVVLAFQPVVPRPGELTRFDATASSDANDEIVSYHWDFGDGQTSDGPIVDHTFLEAGRYTVTLTLIDGKGRAASRTHLVRVLVTALPTIDFSILPSLPERGLHTMDVLGFQDESHDADGELLAWDWRFGDGDEDHGERVLHSYEAPGTYLIWHSVLDDQGERAIQTRSITILSRPPVPEFTFEPARPNQDQAIRFDASSSWDPDGSIVRYRWDFDGDGVIDMDSFDPITEHSFAESGDHTVSLHVVDDTGVESYPVDPAAEPLSGPPLISVNASPTALFSVSTFEPLETESITFADASFDIDGTVVEWEWNFGDEASSNDVSPTHAYDVAADVVVSLTVTDDNGATHTTQAQLRVGNLAPSAALAVDETSKSTHSAFRLDASASSDPSPKGSIAQYEWDFDGDGAYDRTTTQSTVSHSYDDDGTYTARCRVTDNGGGTAVSEDIELVVVNQPPRVTRVSWTPDDPRDSGEIVFTGVGDDRDGDVLRWFWDFGDGRVVVGETATHTFPRDKTFTVTLTVEDDDRTRSEPYVFSIAIANTPPLALLSTSKLDAHTVVFDATASYDPSPDGQIVHVAWDFGDGTTCPGTPSACGATGRLTPVHFYSKAGTYIVTLVVVDEQGALSRTEKTIEILE